MQSFWLALQFLTRFPVPQPIDYSARAMGRSVLSYPIVGLVLGLLLVSIQMLLVHIHPNVLAALLLILWVMVTGGLHLDGLADSADAWMGGQGDRERTLQIMKDPRAGAGAIIWVTLVLVVKFASLSATMGSETVWAALVLSPVLSRSAVIAILLTTPYIRVGGIGAPLAQNLPRSQAMVTLAIVGVAIILIAGWQGVSALVVVCVAGVSYRFFIMRRLGGVTGDTIGALIEILEAAVLIDCAIFYNA